MSDIQTTASLAQLLWITATWCTGGLFEPLRTKLRDWSATNSSGHMMEDADPNLAADGIKKVLISALAALASVATNANTESDQKAVSALDAEYLAAVKNNDATTMDRILADDFVVVTGTGKIHRKADVLNMAGTKQVDYEHQDESHQTSC